jgi:hypothetical protein
MPDPKPGTSQPAGCAGCAALGQRLAAAEDRQRRTLAEVADLEQRLAEAIDLCVALERLHGSTDHAEVLRAIQDVVINLVGSEELAIFEPSAGGELRAALSFGVAGARLSGVGQGAGPVGRAAAEGQAWVVGAPLASEDPDLTACIPLLVEGRVAGVLVVWRLLPHKPALRDSDRRVLELLGAHGGRALYLTALHGAASAA